MTSNPEVSTAKNSQRMTRSQTKRIREEEENNQSDSKRAKTEVLTFKLSSSSSTITIKKTEKNPNLFAIIKQMKSSHDEIKSEITKVKRQHTRAQQKHRDDIAEIDRKREELWDDLEVAQGAYVENRNSLYTLHRHIQYLKMRLRHRGEEVIIEDSHVTFKSMNEE